MWRSSQTFRPGPATQRNILALGAEELKSFLNGYFAVVKIIVPALSVPRAGIIILSSSWCARNSLLHRKMTV